MNTKTAWWLAALLVPALALAQSADKDGDGIPNDQDDCPYTAAGAKVDRTGCALDEDFDGVADGIDRCPSSGLGASVDVDGCAKNQAAAAPQKADDFPPPPPPSPPVAIVDDFPPPPPPSPTGVDPFSVRDAAVEPPAPAPEPVPEVIAAPVPEPIPEPVAPEPIPEPPLPVVVFPDPAPVPPLPDEVRTSLAGGALLKVPKLRPVIPAPVAPTAPVPTANVVTEPIFYGGRRVTVATMVPRAAVPLPAPVVVAPVLARGPWTVAIAKSSELSAANQSTLNDVAGAVLHSQGRYEITGPASQAGLARSYLVAQGVSGDRLLLNPTSAKTGSIEIRSTN